MIRIYLRKNACKAEFSVENTGKGILPEELPHVFERFYKTDSSRSSGSFGLGLAIAKAITERQGAHITAESKPGETTRFEVIFNL